MQVRHWPLFAAIVLVAGGAQAECQETFRKEMLETAWSSLLLRALEGTPEAKAYVKRSATDACEPAVRKLSRQLLAEWDLPPDEASLARPLLVLRPDVDFDSLPEEAQHVSAPSVMIEGEVTPDGVLANPIVLRSSGNQVLDDACLAAATGAMYRPARSEDGFVTEQSIIQFHLDPR
jgi:TonB family protein